VTELRSGNLPRTNNAVQTTICSGGESEAHVEALLLPRDLILPTFTDARQCIYGAPNLLCTRSSTVLDRQHRSDTVKRLCGDYNAAVAWVGHSGIGKTAEVNAVMIELLQNMGKPGWPTKIAHRVDYSINVYELDEISGQVKCSSESGSSLHEVRAFCRERAQEQGWVMILELFESENNPQTHLMPVLIAISSRQGRERLRTLDNSCRLHWFIRGPHLPDELLIAARLTYLTDPKTTVRMADLDPNTTEEQFVSEIAARVKEIGPIMRDVLNGNIYRRFYKIRSACRYECDLRGLRYYDLPGNAKYFVAQHPVGTTEWLRGDHKFKLLSDSAANDLGYSVRSVDSLQTLQMTGLAQQIVEARLLEAMRDPSYDYSEWRRFRDPGCNAALTSRQRLPFHIPWCTQEVCSDTAYTSKDVRTMVNGCAYRAVVASDGLGSFYCYTAADNSPGPQVKVNRPNRKTYSDNSDRDRWITVFQSADYEPQWLPRNPVNMTAVRGFFEAHKLCDDSNRDVKVNLVAVVSSHQPLRTIKGMTFVNDSRREMTIAEVWEHYPEYAGRLHTEFIRAPIYPNLAKPVSAILRALLYRLNHLRRNAVSCG
jgi:hypothetical protein